MSSSKKKPQESGLGTMRAFQVDPEELPVEQPPEVTEQGAAEATPAEEKPARPKAAKPRSSKKAGGGAKKAAAHSAAASESVEGAPESVGDGAWPAWMLELPGVMQVDDELFMRKDGRIVAFSGDAKMTFGVTLAEQLRFQRYARVRGMDYVDLFRQLAGHILSGESE